MRTKKWKYFYQVWLRRSLGGGKSDISTADLKQHLPLQNRQQKDLLGAGVEHLGGCRVFGLDRAWRRRKKQVGGLFLEVEGEHRSYP